MFIIWGLIIPVGIAIARYCKFIGESPSHRKCPDD